MGVAHPCSLADDLFGATVRQRLAEERLYRLVDSLVEPLDLSIDRITWDDTDNSVEVYLDAAVVPETLDVAPLHEAGFTIVWVHPFQCTRNGSRNVEVCKCPGRRVKR